MASRYWPCLASTVPRAEITFQSGLVGSSACSSSFWARLTWSNSSARRPYSALMPRCVGLDTDACCSTASACRFSPMRLEVAGVVEGGLGVARVLGVVLAPVFGGLLQLAPGRRRLRAVGARWLASASGWAAAASCGSGGAQLRAGAEHQAEPRRLPARCSAAQACCRSVGVADAAMVDPSPVNAARVIRGSERQFLGQRSIMS